MDIEKAADWATVLAVFVTFVGGLIWWCWTRWQRNKIVDKDIEHLRKSLQSNQEVSESITKILGNQSETDAVKIGALIAEVSAHLAMVESIMLMSFIRTHRPSRDLPKLSNFRFQWPVKWDDGTR